jgi:3-methylcrotonyl-CoA carboxylase beta subunit
MPQIAAIMGNCVAGGGYLPVLCDKLLMTEGSGPVPRRAGAGEGGHRPEVTHEELGGAKMHAAISGTDRLPREGRRSVPERAARRCGQGKACRARPSRSAAGRMPAARDEPSIFPLRRSAASTRSATCSLLRRRRHSFDEYKAEYGQTLVCGYARIGGWRGASSPTRIIRCQAGRGGLQFGGVIYHDSADKAARFIMDCNQKWTPLVFLQDVNGFMVGRDSRAGGHHPRRGQAGERHQQQPWCPS